MKKCTGGAAIALLGVLLTAACGSGEPIPADGPSPRIVSLAPTATEILFALGAGDNVVGRSKWCDYPPAAADRPAVGDAYAANAERILTLEPDFILTGSATQDETLSALADVAEIHRVMPDDIAGVRAAIGLLAGLTGRERAGAEIIARIDRALESARESNHLRGKRVLFVVQHEPLVVAGREAYVSELLLAHGAENVAGDIERAWPVLSLETLVARDPEVILDASMAPGISDGEVLGFWRRFTTLTSVKNGAVVRANVPALVRPGPRLPSALDALRELIKGGGR